VGDLQVRPLRPSPSPKFHHMFKVGQDALLHVYKTAAHPEVARAIGDRTALQHRAEWIQPRLLSAAIEGPYVLEERLNGRTCNQLAPDIWWQNAVQLLVRMAALRGAPLRKTTFWARYRGETLALCPAELKRPLEEAWEWMGDRPSAPLHGDVQPQNIVASTRRIGLIDWEGFWLEGLPGLDLMFLATMTGEAVPNPVLVKLCNSCADRSARPVTEALERSGLEAPARSKAALVALALWQSGEVRRHRRNRLANARRPFAALLAGAAP
jgi:hypothetical protein